MSVHGEFQRVLAELARFLRGTRQAACARAAEALERCGEAAREDLDGAAKLALEVCDRPAPGDLSGAERDEYVQRAEHLAAICRALLA